nr:flagellar hook-length control protein FliK [Clostridium simiarum]
MENNNMKELTVKIYPKELGQMVITLVLESDRMNAKIMASNKEAYNLLNSNLKDLKNGLLDINLRVDDIQVGIYAEDFMSYSNLPQGFAGGEFQQDKSRTSGQVRDINSASDEALLEDSNETIEDGTINILA